MFRLILLIALILLAIPFYDKVKSYFNDKKSEAKTIADTATKFVKYRAGEKKEDEKK